MEMSSDFNFSVVSWFLVNVHVKAISAHSWGVQQIDEYDALEVQVTETTCLYRLNLIFSNSPSIKIQIVGEKITDNLGLELLLWKVKIFLSFFSFHFQILHT